MCALVAEGGIAAEGDQRGADVVSGDDRRLGITVVVAEQIAAYREAMRGGQPQQLPGQMEVVGPARILQCDGYRLLAGLLALGDRRDVDADELADVPGQHGTGTRTDLLGDGEQRVT